MRLYGKSDYNRSSVYSGTECTLISIQILKIIEQPYNLFRLTSFLGPLSSKLCEPSV